MAANDRKVGNATVRIFGCARMEIYEKQAEIPEEYAAVCGSFSNSMYVHSVVASHSNAEHRNHMVAFASEFSLC